MTIVDGLRLFSVVVLTVCVVQLVLFLSYYWHRIVPLRRELPDVLAPPILVSFAYHLLVTGFFASMVLSQTQMLLSETPPGPTIMTWVTPVMSAIMVWVLHRFRNDYSRILSGEIRRRG